MVEGLVKPRRHVQVLSRQEVAEQLEALQLEELQDLHLFTNGTRSDFAYAVKFSEWLKCRSAKTIRSSTAKRSKITA